MDQTYSEIVDLLAEPLIEKTLNAIAPDGLEVYEVSNKRDLRRFIDFPLELYKDDPNFVFEPFRLQREFLSATNPFFKHSTANLFLAEFQGIIVGRIAAINNTIHNRVYQESVGFFGFFECIRNFAIAKALLDEVKKYHKIFEFSKIIGPTNFTTNDSAGLLIKGFQSPPVVMMPYNKLYYHDFLTRYGFIKETDMSSYYIDDTVLGSQRFKDISATLSSKLVKSNVVIRNVDLKNFDQELILVCSIYNEANKDNRGFIPLTQEEFLHTAHQFRQFVPNDLMLVAHKGEEVIGFIVALPDLNQAFSHIPAGRLFPLGFLKYLKFKKKINKARILILGVKPCYRRMGIDVLLYKKIQENLANHGIYSGEACYVMEDNIAMHSIMSKLEARKIKEYRIYSMEI